MKIVMLCGSLEPGKDGVGDYTRRLAGYCKSLKHEILLVSLNDSWVDEDSFSQETQELRLAKTHSWAQRMEKLTAEVARFQPHFLSLQFVPFAYNERGLCWNLATSLQSFRSSFPWHIMFHELWLGLEKSQPLKFKILGWLQRRVCLRLICGIKPRLSHTQTSVYLSVLEREAIPAKRLMLFSNIEIVAEPDREPIYEKLAAHKSRITRENRQENFVAVFFGALHPEWTPDLMMAKLQKKNLTFIAIGRLHGVGTSVWETFSEKYSDRAEFIEFGELTSPEISAALQFADVGIAASPWNLIEKSGSVAAMIEHGLPVIVCRNDFLPERTFHFDPFWRSRLFPVWQDDFDLENLTKNQPVSRLETIGSQFLSDLAAVRA